MTQFDETFIPLAISLLDKFGTSATLHKITRPDYDGFTDTETPGSVTDVSVTAAPPFNMASFRGDGSAIKATDLMSIVSSVDAAGVALLPPELTDEFTISGSKYLFIEIKPIISGDLTAAYLLGLRKS